jgi:hypothetical protein
MKEDSAGRESATGLPPEGGPRAMPANAGSGTDRRDSARPPQAVERITVALIPKAGEDLQRLVDRTGLSKTDIANRAITLYEFIDDQLRTGRDILIRDNSSGETQIVRLL